MKRKKGKMTVQQGIEASVGHRRGGYVLGLFEIARLMVFVNIFSVSGKASVPRLSS